jgi:CheY-like chemotaxis protein
MAKQDNIGRPVPLLVWMGTSAFSPSRTVLVEVACEDFLQKPVTRSPLRLLLARSLKVDSTAPDTALKTSLPTLAGMHLLVAEDSLVSQQIMKRMLEKAGAKVSLVDTGKAAVEAALKLPTTFDCILMVGRVVESIHIPL